MKSIMTFMAVIIMSLSSQAQVLKPLPDMSSARVSTARDAETVVERRILTDHKEGLSSTESIVAKLSFTLGSAISPFGKKGDRVWQVHRVSFGETTGVTWVNAETEAVHILYPQKNVTPNQNGADNRRSAPQSDR